MVEIQERIGYPFEGKFVTSAREEILRRVRRATHDVPKDERPEDIPVERGYRKEDDAPRDEIVERFAERVAEYEATVHRVNEADLPREVSEALERRSVRWLVVPADLPEGWVPEGVETLRDAAQSQLSNEELDQSDGV